MADDTALTALLLQTSAGAERTNRVKITNEDHDKNVLSLIDANETCRNSDVKPFTGAEAAGG